MKAKLLRKIRKKYYIGIDTDGYLCIMSKTSPYAVRCELVIDFCNELDNLFNTYIHTKLCSKKADRLKLRIATLQKKNVYNNIKSKLPHLKL